MFYKNTKNESIKMTNFFVDVHKDNKTGRNIYWIKLDTVDIPLNSEITIGFDKQILKSKVFSGFHEMIAENRYCTLIMKFYDPQYAALEKDWSYKVINKDGYGYTYRTV